ncbi:MAG: hypothetical protein NTV34_19855 [Proteobacteria bacterium]|nr:hypothetical protein [Pseudomonadota bacterium]
MRSLMMILAVMMIWSCKSNDQSEVKFDQYVYDEKGNVISSDQDLEYELAATTSGRRLFVRGKAKGAVAFFERDQQNRESPINVTTTANDKAIPYAMDIVLVPRADDRGVVIQDEFDLVSPHPHAAGDGRIFSNIRSSNIIAIVKKDQKLKLCDADISCDVAIRFSKRPAGIHINYHPNAVKFSSYGLGNVPTERLAFELNVNVLNDPEPLDVPFLFLRFVDGGKSSVVGGVVAIENQSLTTAKFNNVEEALAKFDSLLGGPSVNAKVQILSKDYGIQASTRKEMAGYVTNAQARTLNFAPVQVP